MALPMVPVRERGGVLLAALERPRFARPAPRPGLDAAPRPAAGPAPHPAPRPAPGPALGPAPPPPERLRIRLPRRTRTASVASVATTPGPRTDRMRTRSGGDGNFNIIMFSKKHSTTVFKGRPRTKAYSYRGHFGILFGVDPRGRSKVCFEFSSLLCVISSCVVSSANGSCGRIKW